MNGEHRLFMPSPAQTKVLIPPRLRFARGILKKSALEKVITKHLFVHRYLDLFLFCVHIKSLEYVHKPAKMLQSINNSNYILISCFLMSVKMYGSRTKTDLMA